MKKELLAPNGKPSNLNATQYKLVRTPLFKKWFGDWINDPENASKVVDENGEPLVVYHGTTEDFSIFLGGSYFTDDYMNADGYASGEIVLETFLNIKNPLIIKARGRKWDNLKNKYGTSTREIVSSINETKYDGVIFDRINDNWFDDENGEPQNVYFTINPNQIKIADGTNTTFDSMNDDIRFYDGGMIKDLINKGIVELKFYETTPEHAREYGLISKKPIYLQTLFVSENSRLKGVGKQVLKYLENYAKNNGNDLIFGHINNKAQFTKDDRENFFSDVDMIRYWLHDNGYAINENNNDFYKLLMPNEVSEKSKYEKGGRTISQTPAPKKDRIVGSDLNKKSSSKNLSSAKLIKFDEKTLVSIKNKVQEHNKQHPDKKINLASAKAVVRRGMGAFSQSYRPTISGGKPNSRVAWGLARLNAFTYKIINGKSKSGKYKQDDDLIEELGFKVADYKNGGEMKKDIRCINCGWEWNKKDSELWDMYVCHKCGFDNTTFYTSIPVNNYSKGGKVESKNPNYLKIFLGK